VAWRFARLRGFFVFLLNIERRVAWLLPMATRLLNFHLNLLAKTSPFVRLFGGSHGQSTLQ
jgi:hypothetical protein